MPLIFSVKPAILLNQLKKYFKHLQLFPEERNTFFTEDFGTQVEPLFLPSNPHSSPEKVFNIYMLHY